MSEIKKKSSTIEEPAEAVPSTMPEAVRRFFFGKDRGPILVIVVLGFFANCRLNLVASAPLGFPDLAALVSSVVFWWFQEHFMHRNLLHCDFDWPGKRKHQGHHEKAYFHICIDSPWMLLSWFGTAHALLRTALPPPAAFSATIGYGVAGLFYEWAHYIVHTRVKPRRGSFLARMRANHMRHHLVSDRYWLAFSVPSIDDLFGTNPSAAEARAENAKREEKSGEKKTNLVARNQ